MAFDTNNLELHIRRLVRSSIRIGCHCACDYPAVLGAGIVLLLLHVLCPSLFAFMMSSSPVIILTAILLGALLSYGEATVPLDGEETLEDNAISSLKSNVYITDYSVKEVENVAVKAQLKKRTETDSAEEYVRERASDDYFTCDPQCEEKNVAYIASDAAVLSGEEYIEERTPNNNLQSTPQCEEKDVAYIASDAVVLSGEEYIEERTPNDNLQSTPQCEEKNVAYIASDAVVLSGEEYIEERTPNNNLQSTPQCEEKNVAYIASDAAVLSGEEYIQEERTPNDNLTGTHCEEKNVTFVADDTVLSAEPFNHTKISATVECKEGTKEIDEKAELQELESTCTGSCNNGVHSQYQFGEFMRSCWQPVMRQDPPCSGYESDLTDESSSADASMTDIIPMLEELHSMINSGTGQLSLASRDNLNSSSVDNEDDLDEEEEEEDVSSDDDEEAERQQDNKNNWKDGVHLNCLDMEQNVKLENLMDLQRAKNILKFELDMRSFDLQSADATRKLKDASSFRVQVPSISTARHNPFDPEISRIPGSAPSVLLPRRNMFDIRFDRVMDHGSRFQETWSPRSRFRSAQNMKHRNSYGQTHSTCMQHDNCEIGDNHSDEDAEQEGNNGKLFGSLGVHLGEEMKILSAAISEVGVLGEVNRGIDEGDNKTSNVGGDDTSSLPRVNNSGPHFMEEDSISEVNSVFKCRMEEVLLQSLSERSVCQPLKVKPEDTPSVSLSSDIWIHDKEASSVEELQFARIDKEALTCSASNLNGDGGSIRDRTNEALPVVNELPTAGDQQAADISEQNELPVLEISSVDEINSLFEQPEEEVQLSNGRSKINIPQDILREPEVDPLEVNSRSQIIDV